MRFHGLCAILFSVPCWTELRGVCLLFVGLPCRQGLHSKLTGAGGGGCGFTLLPPDVDRDALAALVAELTALGFESFETAAGGPGVLLHPAL